MLPQQVGHTLSAVVVRFPYGDTPRMNRLIALWSCGHGKDVRRSQGTAVERQCEGRPDTLILREFHVGSLHLLPGKLLFDVQIQSDESKSQLDRLRLRVRMLRSHGIDDILMKERRIAMREGIAA